MENIKLEDKIEHLSFEIYDPVSDAIAQKTLQDFAGKRLVVFFYPADFTFVCPTELKDLNNSYPDIKNANAEILVVSTDTVFSHKRRVETEKLLENFHIQMVSDRTASLSKMFWVLHNETWNAERGTFIISPEGVVKSSEIVTSSIWRSSHELIRKLHALEFVRTNKGQVCPANWNIWWQTLTPSINIAGKISEALK